MHPLHKEIVTKYIKPLSGEYACVSTRHLVHLFVPRLRDWTCCCAQRMSLLSTTSTKRRPALRAAMVSEALMSLCVFACLCVCVFVCLYFTHFEGVSLHLCSCASGSCRWRCSCGICCRCFQWTKCEKLIEAVQWTTRAEATPPHGSVTRPMQVKNSDSDRETRAQTRTHYSALDHDTECTADTACAFVQLLCRAHSTMCRGSVVFSVFIQRFCTFRCELVPRLVTQSTQHSCLARLSGEVLIEGTAALPETRLRRRTVSPMHVHGGGELTLLKPTCQHNIRPASRGWQERESSVRKVTPPASSSPAEPCGRPHTGENPLRRTAKKRS